jgi:Na+/proline symporter
MSGVFGIKMQILIVTLGLVVTFMTLLGGSWAATAGDFVQMLVVITITLVMAFLTLNHSDIGGFSQLIDKMPSRHFHWSEFSRPWVVIFFAITLMINQTVLMNDMLNGAARYIFVKDGRDAKKAVLVSIAGFLLLAPIWMIPAVGSAILNPDMDSMYPMLKNPNEAAYVAIAMQLLPKGLLGLLVCAIFAATLTTMNSQLNIASGTFVRNFYIRIVNKDATELKQILAGRIFIMVYGVLWIIAALFFNSLKEVKLFDLILLCAASIGIPTAVPLFLGMFIRRTPPWSAWLTLVVGFAVSVVLRFVLVGDFIQNLFDPAVPFNSNEVGDLNIAITTTVLFVTCISVYLFSMLFYKGSSAAYKEQVERFFDQMNTPVNVEKEKAGSVEGDVRQYTVLSTLCLIYGSVILLLLLIPNQINAKICILFCGGLILLIGIILRLISKRYDANKTL